MDEKLSWRFPLTTFGADKGLSTGDKEAFKETPYKTFAREILQNSIDASGSDEDPVIVDFNVFEIDTNDIPGKDALIEQIGLCKEYWNKNLDTIAYCNRMLKTLNEPKVSCLRISDFNTTGAEGAYTMDNDSPFFAMTKGSGHSVKPGIKPSAGSKGMGKNAAYLMSYIDLIFYSTITKRDRGSMGVASFITGYQKEIPAEGKRRDYSQGQGYYSADDENSPSTQIINFDKTYDRNERLGTDLFILGFKNNEGWTTEVINSIMDSFMVAVYYKRLEVNIAGVEIKKDSLQDIINSDVISDDNRLKLQAQYDLLTGNGNVSVHDIETDYGTLKLLVKVYENEGKENATHRCDLIRYPYMKIKPKNCVNNYYPVSAMCIIGDCDLSRKLLAIENPKHDNWEPNRIEDPALRKEIRTTITFIENEIDNIIEKCLNIEEGKSIDPYGAQEYLSSVDEGGTGTQSGGDKKADDTTTTILGKIKTNLSKTEKASEDSSNGDAVQPDIGAMDDDGEDGEHPSGHNQGHGGNPHGDNPGRIKDGDSIILKNVDKTAVLYKFISLGRGTGKYKIVFNAPIDYENCYLQIKMLDDNSKPLENIEFKKVIYDNDEHVFEDSVSEFGPFGIHKDKKAELIIETNITKYFGSEVVVLCK